VTLGSSPLGPNVSGPPVDITPGLGGPALQAKLAMKLVGVMGAISAIPKRGRNTFHGYDYATEGDVADAVRQALVLHKLVLLPSVVDVREREVQTQRGKPETVTTVTMDYTFIDADTGATLRFRMVGAGQDPGDKGVMKAVTAATKYAQLKAFSLSTGDDPEADAGTDHKTAAREPGSDDVPWPDENANGQGGWARATEPAPTDPTAPKLEDCISEGKVRFLYALMSNLSSHTGEPLPAIETRVLAKVQEQLHVAKLEWIPWRGDGFKRLVAWLETQAK
jgi:ERF superfamily